MQNNPLSYSDPTGKFVLQVIGAALTAYDVYKAYEEDSLAGAVKALVEEGIANVATGGIARIAKIGKKVVQKVVKKVEDSSQSLPNNQLQLAAASDNAQSLNHIEDAKTKDVSISSPQIVAKDSADVTNKTGKKYVTYTADDLDNPGKKYTGRCSGTCDMTPQQILDRRKAGHHRNLGELELDQVTDSYSAIRGREQQVLESLREQGLATDQINGVGPRNKKKDSYMDAAKEEFGE